MLYINKDIVSAQYEKAAYQKDVYPYLTQKNNFKIYPFQLIGGATLSTFAGDKGLNSIVNNYSQYQLIFSGDSNVVAEWRNSYEEEVFEDQTDPTNSDKNFLRKYRKVGTYFKGIMIKNSDLNQVSTYSPETSIQQVVDVRTFTLLFVFDKNFKGNDELLTNFETYRWDLFMCPSIVKQWLPKQSVSYPKKGGKGEKTLFYDMQLFKLVSTYIYYNGTNDPQAISITFASANDFFANSGMSLNEYIRFGGAGETAAIPYEPLDNSEPVLDIDWLKDMAVRQAQVQIFGNAAISSVKFFGYRAKIGHSDEKKLDYIDISMPHEIYFAPFRFQAPIYDNTRFRSLSFTNFSYCYKSQIDAIAHYADLRAWLSKLTSDPTKAKQTEGVMILNKGLISEQVDYPQLEGVTVKGQYWNMDFLIGIPYDLTFFGENLLGNPFFQAFDPDTNKNVIAPNISANHTLYGLSDLLYVNSLVYYNVQQIPITVKSWLPITVDAFVGAGIHKSSKHFGGFYTRFTSWGLPIGGRLPLQVSSIQTIPYYSFIIPTSFVDYAWDVFGKTPGDDGVVKAVESFVVKWFTGGTEDDMVWDTYLPLDLFKNNTKDTILSIAGLNSATTSIAGELTDIVKLDRVKWNEATQLFEVLETAYKPSYMIGQSDQGGYWLTTLNSDSTDNLLKGMTQDASLTGFIVCGAEIDAIAKTDFRLSYFTTSYASQGGMEEINENEEVWNGYFKTKSTVSDNIYMWRNKIIHSNPFFETEKTFIFPKDSTPVIMPPSSLVWLKSDDYYYQEVVIYSPGKSDSMFDHWVQNSEKVDYYKCHWQYNSKTYTEEYLDVATIDVSGYIDPTRVVKKIKLLEWYPKFDISQYGKGEPAEGLSLDDMDSRSSDWEAWFAILTLNANFLWTNIVFDMIDLYAAIGWYADPLSWGYDRAFKPEPPFGWHEDNAEYRGVREASKEWIRGININIMLSSGVENYIDSDFHKNFYYPKLHVGTRYWMTSQPLTTGRGLPYYPSKLIDNPHQKFEVLRQNKLDNVPLTHSGTTDIIINCMYGVGPYNYAGSVNFTEDWAPLPYYTSWEANKSAIRPMNPFKYSLFDFSSKNRFDLYWGYDPDTKTISLKVELVWAGDGQPPVLKDHDGGLGLYYATKNCSVYAIDVTNIKIDGEWNQVYLLMQESSQAWLVAQIMNKFDDNDTALAITYEV